MGYEKEVLRKSCLPRIYSSMRIVIILPAELLGNNAGIACTCPIRIIPLVSNEAVKWRTRGSSSSGKG